MSEEEKTLIFAKHYIKDNEGVFEFPKKELEILVNLIEKQNNRLEQLEKENKELKISNAVYVKDNDYLMGNSIPKSVIREKIKHYEECEEFYGSMETTDKYSDGVIVDEICKVLRKILGEEQ